MIENQDSSESEEQNVITKDGKVTKPIYSKNHRDKEEDEPIIGVSRQRTPKARIRIKGIN